MCCDFRRTTTLGRPSSPVWSAVALHRPAESNKSHIPPFLAGEETRTYPDVRANTMAAFALGDNE